VARYRHRPTTPTARTPRAEESPASLDAIFKWPCGRSPSRVDGVVLRTLNRELGGSHNLLNGRSVRRKRCGTPRSDWRFSLWRCGGDRVRSHIDRSAGTAAIIMRTFLIYSGTARVER